MSAYPQGTEVHLHAYADDGYVFDYWSGDASGTSSSTYITMNSNKSVVANFKIDTSSGGIRVFLSPQAAVDEGAGWKQVGKITPTNWQPSGEDWSNLPPGTYALTFKTIPDWVAPDNYKIQIPGGPTIDAYATYREIKGSVQVTLTPDSAKAAGARWRLDGGAWQESGVTIPEVSTANHTVEFLAPSGWTAPPSQNFPVMRNSTAIRNGDYSPPAGLPIITAISPATGPLAGGTTVTIDGANFAPNSTVTFGNTNAASVTYVSPSQVTAVSPPRTSYGSVALSVHSAGQIASDPNGFAYLNALGANMDLISQIGGNVQAVAVVGNTVYYGEGPGLVVLDITSPNSPVERGRVPLPSAVKDIVVSGNIAFVAANSAGLYAVDVSVPTAPSIVGLYDTDVGATDLAILGSIAYLADGRSLEIFDISDPAAIVRVGSVSTPTYAAHVTAGPIGGKLYAFFGEDLGLDGAKAVHVVDVTNPAAPVEIANIPAGNGVAIKDLSLAGNKLYVSDYEGFAKIFDVSVPASPQLIGTIGNVGTSISEVSGTRFYTCGGGLSVFDLNVVPNPTRLGYFDSSTFCDDLIIAGGLALAAMGRDGLKIIDITNPQSMFLRSSVGTLGAVEEVFLVGNTLLIGNDTGLHTVDVSNPAKPVRLGSLPGNRVTDIVAAAGKATLVNYGEKYVRIAGISNPASPTLLGTYNTVGPTWNLGLMGDVPVLAEASTNDAARLPKIDVLNISNPAAPHSTGSAVLGTDVGSAHALTVSGTWGFAGVSTSSQNRIDVVDLANPGAPARTGTLPFTDFLRDIATSSDGDYLYAPSSLGTTVIDARTKTAPAVVGVVDPLQTSGKSGLAAKVVADHLYADNGGSIFAFDLSSPATPTILGYYRLPGFTAYGIAGTDELIFVAGYNAGVSIYRLRDVGSPTVGINSPTANPTFPTLNEAVTLAGVATDNVGVTRVVWYNNRGGGGVAVGTTTWTIANLQLALGLNQITVTAEDEQGNLGSDVIEITATFPDTTPPVVAITGPKPEAEFVVATSVIDMVGTAFDNQAVTGVAWSNSAGGSGTAQLDSDAWTVAGVVLQIGPNLIEVTATDSSSNTTTTSALVFMLPPDTTNPVIAVDFPTANQELQTLDPTLNISGSSSDDVGVNRIEWSNSRGGSGTAEGVSPWSVNGIGLQIGLNVLEVRAFDDAGNFSSDSLVVSYGCVNGEICRAPAGECDAAELCASYACPPDGFAPTAMVCRASAGACDVAETCDGTSSTCPADLVKSSTTTCRVAAGPCDVAERCSGTSAACPAEGLASTSTVCRASQGTCDPAEACTGTNASCPLDARVTNNTPCADDGNACTNDLCDGTSPACQHPVNTLPCEDSFFCNGPDTCSGGSCSVHAGNPCSGPDGDSNCAESCNEVGDTCTAADPNGSGCDDGNSCTKTDVCTSALCAGTPDSACGTTTTTVPEPTLCGDANHDGMITASDALAALRVAVGSGACEIAVCDYSGDGKVTASDALAILRVAVGQIVVPKCPSALADAVTTTEPATTTSREGEAARLVTSTTIGSDQ